MTFSWLTASTRFQRVTLGMALLALAAWIAGLTGFLTVFWIALLCLFAFRKQAMWSVRSRLLRTYFLLGIVPLFLIGWMLLLSGRLFLGNIASERAAQAMQAQLGALGGLAQDLALATSRAATPDLLEDLHGRIPRLSAVIRTSGGTLLLPDDATLRTPPPELPARFQGVLLFQNAFFLAARAPGTRFDTDVLVYLPLNRETLLSLGGDALEIPEVLYGDFDANIHPMDGGIDVTQKGVRRGLAPRRLPAAKGWWDGIVAGYLSWPIKNPNGGDGHVALPILSRPSLLLSGSLRSSMASITIPVLLVLGGAFLLVELTGLILTAVQTRQITRSIHDLYKGTQHVARQDFSHRIPVRGEEQLSELAGSFNGMTAQIQHYLGEMRKKEKIESELEIARQVQARLFPRSVPELKTLEMRGVCLPGRFISGDYYDFVRLNSRYTAIVLGDVSGKGVSAALLMASIQAALHAQLGFHREQTVLSTAALMGLISQQLYENTPAEKYATFFCSVYDDESGVLRYTNAGHLKPILVRAGNAATLDGEGMVAGLLPNVKYEQQEIQLQPGDLIAIFSDGVTEAENAAAEEYGEQRLGGLLRENAGRPLDEIVSAITSSVSAWAVDPDGRDDTTVVLLRRRGAWASVL